MPAAADDAWDGETYLEIQENTVKQAATEALVTLSLKVDTAAYGNVQRYIESGSLPPADAVRTEELINYFSYDAPLAFEDGPFAVYTEVGHSILDPQRVMAFIRVNTEDVDKDALPPSNLTFLIDTSGSMSSYDKLPLLQEAFGLLTETLDEDDTVSIVTYAGSSAVVLDSVSGQDKDVILRAIDSLSAGGSTAGAEGIKTAYALAQKNYAEGGNNRVILASDGDFNVGISNVGELSRFIADKRDSGVYLSVLGFGTGNLHDDVMETLARDGNGNYAYINSVSAAKKTLVEELATNLFTVADDVKAQVEFNPQNVSEYRLIGYENRRLSNDAFADDTMDAGELGVGTDVVILFELTLAGGGSSGLKYAQTAPTTDGEYSDELFEVRIRYKNPGETDSKLILRPVPLTDIREANSTDFHFASAAAAFGELLRNSAYAGTVSPDDVIERAKASLGGDAKGYRREFVMLLQRYKELAR
jgi:Ca-activated chloride channel family protein